MRTILLSLVLLSLAVAVAAQPDASAEAPAPPAKMEPALTGIKCLETKVGAALCVVCAKESMAPAVSCTWPAPAATTKAAKK